MEKKNEESKEETEVLKKAIQDETRELDEEGMVILGEL